jgi:imidazoleglycerol-phosphate dehydratase
MKMKDYLMRSRTFSMTADVDVTSQNRSFARQIMNVDTKLRAAEIVRKTKETDIRVALTLDGSGRSSISTGLPFLDHMLELFARHGVFDLEVECRGDLEVDDHHSVEDVAICLGLATAKALGDKSGIARYGMSVVPMDEALCRSVIDLSGRFYLVYAVQTRRHMIGNFSVELAEHFWRSFAEAARCNLHIDCLRGRNTHHILEGTFKATARALREAVARDSRIEGVLSTKGVL